MEYQIILLPRKDYWEWVRACREYVKHYGPNLTDDPGTAGRYMTPAQVITFPLVPAGYPDQGDLEDWLIQQYPGIRLDPIAAANPGEFEKELELRIEQQDRYGQKRRPFYLLWPTDYAVVTQAFGANPQIYSRFGMPGHEGLDIRALMNTNIYSCADGEVYLVHTNPKSHAYGIHVRIRHKDGYKTVYGHLAQPLVKVGQHVTAGQVIGKADSTGASTGSHLHLTLKRDGATKRGETIYPKDVIDPSPFIVWPERSRKAIPSAEWSPGVCLSGVHPRVSGPMQKTDLDLIKALEPEAIMLSLQEPPQNIEHLQRWNPDLFLMTSLRGDLSGDGLTPEQYIGITEAYLREHYQMGVRYFELGSEPNVQTGGLGRSWTTGEDYAKWFLAVVEKLKSAFPEIKLGYPGLSPGGDLAGWRRDQDIFLDESEEALHVADWVGVHAFWTDPMGMRTPTGGRIFEQYRRRHPDKLLFITEYNNPSPSLSTKQRAEQYHEYLRIIRGERGLGAAFLYALTSDEDGLVYTLNRNGDDTAGWIEPLKASQG